jgi:hypothetical protein
LRIALIVIPASTVTSLFIHPASNIHILTDMGPHLYSSADHSEPTGPFDATTDLHQLQKR